MKCSICPFQKCKQVQQVTEKETETRHQTFLWFFLCSLFTHSKELPRRRHGFVAVMLVWIREPLLRHTAAHMVESQALTRKAAISCVGLGMRHSQLWWNCRMTACNVNHHACKTFDWHSNRCLRPISRSSLKTDPFRSSADWPVHLFFFCCKLTWNYNFHFLCREIWTIIVPQLQAHLHIFLNRFRFFNKT